MVELALLLNQPMHAGEWQYHVKKKIKKKKKQRGPYFVGKWTTSPNKNGLKSAT
jgi:hypothetical protein